MPDVMTPPKSDPTPVSGASAAAEAARKRNSTPEPALQVRAADLEPYVGLKYLSRLFKLMAVVIILLLVSDIITSLFWSDLYSPAGLLAEVSKFVVLAGLLWGSGDLALLFIDIGHDMRATRILIGRQLAHHTDEHHAEIDPAMTSGTNTPLPLPPSEPIAPV